MKRRSKPKRERHLHVCDCDECLNQAPVKLEAEPVVRTVETPFRESVWAGSLG